MLVICLIALTFKLGGINFIDNNVQVEGKVLSESRTAYLVDFSKNAAEKNAVSPADYKKYFVSKERCVKE